MPLAKQIPAVSTHQGVCADLFRFLCFCICGPQNIGCGGHNLIEKLISTHKPPFLWPGFSIRHPWIREAELYEAVWNVCYRDASWVFCGSIYRRAGKGGSQPGTESTYALYFVWSVRLCGPSGADEHTAVTWLLAATHPVRVAPLRYIQPYWSSWFRLFLLKCNGRHVCFSRHCLTDGLGVWSRRPRIALLTKTHPISVSPSSSVCRYRGAGQYFSLILVLTKAAQLVPCVLLLALAMHHGLGCHSYSSTWSNQKLALMDKTSVDGNTRCPLLGEC
ncbi:hypothetical protein QR685DRAFT_241319 [Neurospora intermedia]|uniref:Uncharacterized protein n=1 Tax=Neurospora intermedia TaxID=5142 RepID=A0ABR3DIV8_NEUIN